MFEPGLALFFQRIPHIVLRDAMRIFRETFFRTLVAGTLVCWRFRLFSPSMSEHRISPVVRRALLACVMFVLASALSIAQSTRGKEFWVGFMAHTSASGQPITLTLHITSRVNTTGLIYSPRYPVPIPFGVPANTVRQISLEPHLFLSLESEGVANRGIRIVTLDTVDVWALSYIPQTMDGALVLAKGALGSDYRIMSYEGIIGENNVPLPSQFLIVATENGTSIQITPSAMTMGGRPAGTPFNVTLNAEQTYQVQSRGDLTGTRVVATNGKPFALFSGHARGRVPLTAPFQNHFFEQLFPVDRWGVSFISVPYRTRRGDTYRILAAENNTTVRINGGPGIRLDAGGFMDTLLLQASTFNSDRPISIAQFSNGSDFDNVFESDAFMLMLNPVDFVRRDALLPMFQVTSIRQHYINLVAYTADISSVQFDGTPIGHLFTPVTADEFYSHATVITGSGPHSVTSNLGIIANVYGYGSLEGYGYFGGAEQLIGCPLPTITALGDTVFCEGGSVVLDAGPGYAGYIWSTGETTRQITVTGTGEYSVITSDTNGCRKPARPVQVQSVPLPDPSVTVLGSTTLCPCDSVLLVAAPGNTYLWSNGATSDTLVVREPGTFTVTVMNEAGCPSTSAPITINSTEVTSTVALGRDSAAPGGRVSIPLILTSSGGLAECGAHTFIATLRFNASILQVQSFGEGTLLSDTTIGTERFIILEGNMAGDTLLTLDGFATLGNAPSTQVGFIWFRWDRCDLIPVNTNDGEFTLLDLCLEGDTRLLDGFGAMMLKQNTPNPATGLTTIEYEIVEDGPTQLYITNAAGRTVLTPVNGHRSRGHYMATFDASLLPSGTYHYILQTATQRLGRNMIVVK